MILEDRGTTRDQSSDRQREAIISDEEFDLLREPLQKIVLKATEIKVPPGHFGSQTIQ